MMASKFSTEKKDYFIIPNPIYDVVFKYLMEDAESAKIILSTLINEKIISLEFEATSHAQKIIDPGSDKEIRLFHLDFTATIELQDGSTETVMIELQKAKIAGDIFRFKRYICTNFQKKKESEVVDPITREVEKIEAPIRLIPIFILNFRIEDEINDLLIWTNRIKHGVFKGKRLKKNNEFIDHLTYDMLVVQIPNLSNISEAEFKNDEYKSKIYYLLKIFDQDSQTDDKHRLVLMKQFFPDFMQRVIMRLQAADSNNPDLEEQMIVEDEYLAELVKRDNKISYFQQLATQEKQRAEEERQRAEEERQRAEEERQRAEQKDKELKEERIRTDHERQRADQKDQELQRERTRIEQEIQKADENKQVILDLARMLKENGMDIEMIGQKTKLTRREIEDL